MNITILAFLRDYRFFSFRDSLLGLTESSLSNGPVYFSCYPNFRVCLNYQNILYTLTLNIKTYNYNTKPGSILITYIYRIQCKMIQSTFESRTTRHDQNGDIIFFQADLYR